MMALRTMLPGAGTFVRMGQGVNPMKVTKKRTLLMSDCRITLCRHWNLSYLGNAFH